MKNDTITLRILNIVIFVTVILSLLLFIFSMYYILRQNTKLEQLEKQRSQIESSASIFAESSSLLSRFVWKYAETQDAVFVKQYFNEYRINQNREKAVINTLLFPLTDNERALILDAKSASDALVYGELWTIRLIAESAPSEGMPAEVMDFPLAAHEASLSDAEKREMATRYLFGIEYNLRRQRIVDAVQDLRIAFNKRYADNALRIINEVTTFSLVSGVLLVLVLVFLLAVIAYHKRIEEKFRRRLQEIAAEANRANLAKSDFLSRMSHDLRTPMNAIIGLSLAARDRTLADAEMCLEKINNAGIHLLQLINDTLDMSKIENKKLDLKLAPALFADIIQTVSTIIQPAAQEKNIVFRIDAETESVPPLLMDRLRINQILLNLLNNAVKFTPSGGSVTLTIRVLAQTAGSVRYSLSVKDTGKGISAAFREKLFTPFEQEDHEQQGTGLGLAIVKNIVERMGGSIRFRSERDSGTEFVITLENAVAEALPEHSEAQPGDSELEGTLVLLVEDNDINALVATRLLARKGMRVERAANGRQALELFQNVAEGTYALILMDIRMPGMDGLEATRRLRALKRGDAATVPVIAMTANAFDEDIELSLRAGMNAHISKPIKPDILFTTISRVLRRERP